MRVRQADQFLQSVKLLLLLPKVFLLSLILLLLLFDGALLFGYLCLLLLNGVDENGGDLSILDAFDFTFGVACRQKRFDLLDVFRAEADIAHSAAPVENDGV